MSTTEKIRDLRQKRAKALADARAINDKAANENRNLSDEERASYKLAMDDFNRFGDDITREQELQREEEIMNRAADQQVDQDTRAIQTPESMSELQKQERAFLHWARTGSTSEFRTLQVDSNVDGGYLVAPQQMAQGIIQAVDNALIMRGLCTTVQVPTAQSLGKVSLDADPDDPEWTTELGTGNTDASMAFGKRELSPHPLATKLLVSKEMLRVFPGILSLVYERLGYKVGVKQENAFLNGSGANQPLGLFTASNDGIPTSRDVSTDMGTTAPTIDGLKRVKGTLKSQYRMRPSTRWIFHRDVMTEIGLLKDGTGNYLLQPDIRNPDDMRLLGITVMESEYAPNTLTTGQYIGLLGDLSNYMIADAMDIGFQRLVELYAATNKDGFHVRAKTDGMPTLAEAFVRAKLA